MSLEVAIKPKLLEYDPSELERWELGDRDYCADWYCRKVSGTRGFGEYVVGRHFERLGYEWIHHDFDVFGTNAPGKYPRSEEVLLNFFGAERLRAARSLYKRLKPFRESRKAPVETPDLLIFNRDASEVRFAESKRTDTGDRVNRRQVIGLTLIAALYRCPVDFFLVAPKGTSPSLETLRFGFP